MMSKDTVRKLLWPAIPLMVAGIALYYSGGVGGDPSSEKEQAESEAGKGLFTLADFEEERAAEAAAERAPKHPAYELYAQTRTGARYIEDLDRYLSMPSENDFAPASVNRWIFKGPLAADLRGTQTDYCGRVRDLEIEGVPSLRAAGATGGLFKTVLFIPVAMSDSLNTLNMGAFATSPRDPRLVLLGTGEPPAYDGTGLWRTTDEGESWRNILTIPSPSIFYEIMFQPGSGTVAHAACNSGLYKSTNGGESWVPKLSGVPVTSLDIAPLAPNIVYATKRGDGVYKSVDFGDSYTKLTGFPLTGSDFSTASVGIAHSNINIVYVAASNDAGISSGIFRSTDGGSTWQDRSWRDSTGALIDLHWSQGDRNNCIGVSPTDPDLLLVGGGGLIRSTDGGANYTAPPITHADMCAIKWKSDGSAVYIGNDGGIAYSTDGGAVWSTTGSVFPFTQFWSIEAASGPLGFVFVGGTQDNAILNTSNNGTRWYVNLTGDGGFVTMDKNKPGTQIAMTHSGSWVPHNLNRSTDYGETWAGNGLDRSKPGGMVQNDYTNPVEYFYAHSNRVYRSVDAGETWSPLGDALPAPSINAISVGRRTGSLAPVYAVLLDTTNRIMFYDGTAWVPRTNGLPAAYFNRISQHPTDNNTAYAYTYYNLYPGGKIFKTTNKGLSWTNVTGDLPNFNITGVIAHPTDRNILFASTTWYGVFKSTNGGANWFRWMNGMPKTLWVEALAYVDSTAINGRFYVVAGSHGRGVWVREAGGEELATSADTGEQPQRYLLHQNHPNPFNPSTSIRFDLSARDEITLEVFDITGRVVKQLINRQMYEAGSHEVRFTAVGLASGTYFYRLTSPRFSAVRKMLLTK